MKLKALSFLLLPLLCFAEEPIVVHLPTQAKQIPIYLEPLVLHDQTPARAKELYETLRFDLDHTGRTRIAAETPERKAQSSQDEKSNSFDGNAWAALGVPYVLKGSLHDGALHLRLLASGKPAAVASIRIPLGSRASDRQRVHEASDALHKALFGEPGIASTRLLYTVRTRSGALDRSEVYLADYDGKNARPVTGGEDFCVTPAFLPPDRGKRSGSFLYVAYRHGQPKIYAATISEGVGRKVTTLRGQQLMPAVTRARDQLAFISDASGAPDLFIQSFDMGLGATGKARQIFSAPRAAQATPTFSPSGKRLAFVSDKDGTARIYVMEIPAPGQQPKVQMISRTCRDNTCPSWSPDGKKLAYSSRTEGTRQIWIYDFEVREEYQLTQGPGHKENPTWAPNSLHLVYNSVGQRQSDLFLIDLNRRRATKITSGPGEKRFPSWEPIAR